MLLISIYYFALFLIAYYLFPYPIFLEYLSSQKYKQNPLIRKIQYIFLFEQFSFFEQFSLFNFYNSHSQPLPPDIVSVFA